jgi:hypothetical protein
MQKRLYRQKKVSYFEVPVNNLSFSRCDYLPTGVEHVFLPLSLPLSLSLSLLSIASSSSFFFAAPENRKVDHQSNRRKSVLTEKPKSKGFCIQKDNKQQLQIIRNIEFFEWPPLVVACNLEKH